MNLEDWKAKFISILKNKIKSHEKSIDLSLDEIDELIEELHEEVYFQEYGFLIGSSPVETATACYNLWLTGSVELLND